MIRRNLALAVLGILVLMGGAMALLDGLTEPSSPGAATAATTAEPLAPAPPWATPDHARPPEAAPLNPLVQVEQGAQPPQVPTSPQARSDRLIEFRTQRRDTALEQQNAREAARRARLGLPPASGAPAFPPPAPRRPGQDS